MGLFGNPRSLEDAFADKDEYVSKNLVFDIVAIEYEVGLGYEGQNRWKVVTEVHQDFKDRGQEFLTFSPNPPRDEQFSAAQKELEKTGRLTNIRLKRAGKMYYLAD